jgi:hypothetical protein
VGSAVEQSGPARAGHRREKRLQGDSWNRDQVGPRLAGCCSPVSGRSGESLGGAQLRRGGTESRGRVSVRVRVVHRLGYVNDRGTPLGNATPKVAVL